MFDTGSRWWHEVQFRRSRGRGPLPLQALHAIRSRVWKRTEMWFYDYAADDVAALPRPTVLRRDAVSDLLLYERQDVEQPSRDAFLRQMDDRLASGQHCYTATHDRRLVHYSWLIDREVVSVDRALGYEVRLPANSAFLYDSFTDAAVRGRGMYRAALLQMLHDAVAVAGARHCYCTVDTTNVVSRRSVEKVGFRHVATIGAERRAFRVRRYSECLDERLHIGPLDPEAAAAPDARRIDTPGSA